MGATEKGAGAAVGAVDAVAAVVRGDAALLEDDLAEFLGSLTAPAAASSQSVQSVRSVYEAALRRSLYEPVADAVGSKVGQEALPPAAGAPGGNRAPLRPSMVYWAYRNYRGFPTRPGTRRSRRTWRSSGGRPWPYGSC